MKIKKYQDIKQMIMKEIPENEVIEEMQELVNSASNDQRDGKNFSKNFQNNFKNKKIQRDLYLT